MYRFQALARATPWLFAFTLIFPGARPAASQALAAPEPAWLHQKLREGWQQVQQGVLTRDTGGGRVETLSYGQAGLRWSRARLQERIDSLQREHAQYPSAETAEVIASLKSELDLNQSAPQADSFGVDSVTAGCEPEIGVHAAADPLPASQGVTANADASYRSPCGDLGNVYSYAYSRATFGSTMTVKIQEDPKNDGTNLASAVAVSVNGSLDCFSEAYARAWSPALGISVETSDTNSVCPGTTPPPAPSGWTDDGSIVRLTNASDNVGIGTSSPQVRLHVSSGEVRFPAGTGGAGETHFNFSIDGRNYIRGTTMIADNGGYVGIGVTNPLAPFHVGTGEIRFPAASDGSGNTQFNHSSGKNYIRGTTIISDSGGSVGIGITDPQAKLHVGTGEVRFPAASDGFGQTHFNHSSGKNYIRGTTVIGDSGGSVGIGTQSPLSKLHVNGGDIRVQGGSFIDDGTTLNAPDYVFEPEYRLMPLGELRDFIARERHLPNVPSAADIKGQGLNLSQFQMRLLEKIEELALYTLTQDEQIKAQQAHIADLQAAKAALDARLAALEQAAAPAVER